MEKKALPDFEIPDSDTELLAECRVETFRAGGPASSASWQIPSSGTAVEPVTEVSDCAWAKLEKRSRPSAVPMMYFMGSIYHGL